MIFFNRQAEAGRAQGEAQKKRHRDAIELALNDQWDELKESEPELFLRYAGNFKKIKHLLEPRDLECDVECLWFFGNTGTGKSRWVRHKWGGLMDNGQPQLYDKGLNKWFDGYERGQYLLIEEISPDHKWMGDYLKRWSDRYPFSCEEKGSSRKSIRPTKVFVTSNYHPADIWHDSQILNPLLRRFKCVEVLGPDDTIQRHPECETLRPMTHFA